MILVSSPVLADFGLSNVVEREISGISGDSKPFSCEKKMFYPYTIHLSSWKNLSEAMEEMNTLGFVPGITFITKIALKKNDVWYRIDYGFFTTEKEASEKLKELQGMKVAPKDAFVGTPTPYAIEAGAFAFEQETTFEDARLRGKGIIPYVIKETDGCFRLLVGAYPNKKSAKQALEEMKNTGIALEISER